MYYEIYNFYHHLQAFTGSEMTIGCIQMYYDKKLFSSFHIRRLTMITVDRTPKHIPTHKP